MLLKCANCGESLFTRRNENPSPLPACNKCNGVMRSTSEYIDFLAYTATRGSVSSSPRGKAHPIFSLEVADGLLYGGSRMTRLQIECEDKLLSLIQLSDSAAIALATALLQRIPDVTIAVNERLLNIVNSAKQRSDDDAKAVVDCIKSRQESVAGMKVSEGP